MIDSQLLLHGDPESSRCFQTVEDVMTLDQEYRQMSLIVLSLVTSVNNSNLDLMKTCRYKETSADYSPEMVVVRISL